MAGQYPATPFPYNYSKSTNKLRLGYEGLINGAHKVDTALTEADTTGKLAKITAAGLTLANAGDPVIGIFADDLSDMVQSGMATFYFRGGEYYVRADRFTDATLAGVTVGSKLVVDAGGKYKVSTGGAGEVVVGVVTHVGTYAMGSHVPDSLVTGTTDQWVGFIFTAN